MKLSRDLSNLVVFTNSVASQECLNDGLTHAHSKKYMLEQILCIVLCLRNVSLQVLQVMSCPLVRPEPSLWSITKRNSSWLLTRGSCHGFIHRLIELTRQISTLSSTGTWGVSWVRQMSSSVWSMKLKLCGAFLLMDPFSHTLAKADILSQIQAASSCGLICITELTG